MELPYFKAFPTDWEITMRKAGIPPAKRGTVYRLIFFAWQEQGLNLTEDESYERRMRVLAQAFGMSYCRFKPYLVYYKSLSECQNGLWLPSFLLQQLHHAMRFQSNTGTKSEQSQNNTRTKSEQSQNNISGLSLLPATPLYHKQEQEQEQESAREENPASPALPPALPAPPKATEPEETTAVDLFRQTFPSATVSIHTQTVIEAAEITDLPTWQATLTAWRTNGYSERNLSGLFDKYRDEAAKAKKSKDWWSRGKSKGFTGAVVSSVIAAVQPSKPTVAGGDARRGDGRVADGAAPDSPGTVAAPVQSRPPNTRPETLREANKRRQSEIRLVEVASEPEMGCPF